MAWTSTAHPCATTNPAANREKGGKLTRIARGGDFDGHHWGPTWPPVDTTTATSGAFATAIDTWGATAAVQGHHHAQPNVASLTLQEDG
jgi:hypothetical protein